MKEILPAKHLHSLAISKLRQIMDSAPRATINLGLGEIRFPLHPIFQEAAKEIISNKKLFYTSNAGLIELRKKICQYYQIPFNENICVTSGAEEAVFSALFAYLDAEAEVLIANPSYVAYNTIIRMMKAVPVSFELNKNDFHFDEENFLQAVSCKTKAVLLNNPINPTGTTYSEEDLQFIADFCDTRNILLIVDEVYRELFVDLRVKTILNYAQNAIVISSLSKSHGLSGWRLGWTAAANPTLIEPIIKVHQYICTCASALSQEIALIAFSDAGNRIAESIRHRLDLNRNILLQQIPAKNILPNNHHPYLFVKIEDDLMAVNKLLQNNVVVMPGSAFGILGRGWIRINYAVSEQDLRKGIEKVLELL